MTILQCRIQRIQLAHFPTQTSQAQGYVKVNGANFLPLLAHAVAEF
jgi:hypothetical protein